MTDYIEYVALALAVGFVAGWYAREYRAKLYLRRLEHLMAENFGTMVAEAAKSVVEIIVTREGDMFYVHNKNTGEFLAQGRDHNAIANVLSDRFPQATFMANPDDLEKIGYTK